MGRLFDTMQNCTIALNGNSIFASDYLCENMRIVSDIFSKAETSRSMMVTPNVDIPFYASLIGAAFTALESAEETDILSKLNQSDLVILDGKIRCKFISANETHFVKLLLLTWLSKYVATRYTNGGIYNG